MVLRTGDTSLEGPIYRLAPAVPHLPLGLMAAAICLCRVVLGQRRTDLTLPAFLINSKRADYFVLLQGAGCLQELHN